MKLLSIFMLSLSLISGSFLMANSSSPLFCGKCELNSEICQQGMEEYSYQCPCKHCPCGQNDESGESQSD
jgi:hypothetical protein